MRSKSILLILIAAVCGTVAATGVSQALKDSGDGPAPVLETEKIFVAAKEIDIREKFAPENIRLEEWPKGKIPQGAIADLEEINGQYARTRLYEGEVILHKKLMSENEVGSHEITIPPGYRVKSVQVSMESAVSNLVMPGSRVDVLVFLKEAGDIPRTGAYTILKNVRVFAVNEKVNRDIDNDGQSINARTVSLLVKPDQVEKLLVAGSVGRLELSLRRPDDDTDDETISDDMTALADLLRNRQKEGADEKEEQPATPPSDFTSFLAQESQTATAEPVEAATMIVMTPEGSTRYRWTDLTQLPEVSASPAAALPAATPALPVLTPSAPALPAPPGAPASGVGLPSGLQQLMDTAR
ncbi:MAG: Flp pilus assembly protein CpaB [Planctomycetes bacterium]|nr:Flp pilus assembly protein CpaB [Planctomycetota bacterium]